MDRRQWRPTSTLHELDNPATWAWTLNISGHAPVSVPVPDIHAVPDAGSTLALFGIAIGAIGAIRAGVRK